MTNVSDTLNRLENILNMYEICAKIITKAKSQADNT